VALLSSAWRNTLDDEQRTAALEKGLAAPRLAETDVSLLADLSGVTRSEDGLRVTEVIQNRFKHEEVFLALMMARRQTREVGKREMLGAVRPHPDSLDALHVVFDKPIACSTVSR
jgi:hypothetical protein